MSNCFGVFVGADAIRACILTSPWRKQGICHKSFCFLLKTRAAALRGFLRNCDTIATSLSVWDDRQRFVLTISGCAMWVQLQHQHSGGREHPLWPLLWLRCQWRLPPGILLHQQCCWLLWLRMSTGACDVYHDVASWKFKPPVPMNHYGVDTRNVQTVCKSR